MNAVENAAIFRVDMGFYMGTLLRALLEFLSMGSMSFRLARTSDCSPDGA